MTVSGRIRTVLYVEANTDNTIGGSHYCLLELVKSIRRSAYRPIVCFYQKNAIIDEFRKYSEVIIFPYSRGFSIKNDTPWLFILAAKNVVFMRSCLFFQKFVNLLFFHLVELFWIAAVLVARRIDIVHLNNTPVLTKWRTLSKLFRVPCISHLRGRWPFTLGDIRRAESYDHIIAISRSIMQYAKDSGLSGQNVSLIYDGIDVKSLLAAVGRDASHLRRQLDLKPCEFIVGLVGNIKPWKGQHIAIEAVKQLVTLGYDVKCLLIGEVSALNEDRDYCRRLKRQVAEARLGDKIKFLGYRRDVPELIQVMNVLLHTSTEPEPLGRVVLEGMVFSKPVVATAIGGPIEIIEDGVTGYLVRPGDSSHLVETLKTIISDPNAADRVGKSGGAAVVEKFDISISIKAIEQLYEKVFCED